MTQTAVLVSADDSVSRLSVELGRPVQKMVASSTSRDRPLTTPPSAQSSSSEDTSSPVFTLTSDWLLSRWMQRNRMRLSSLSTPNFDSLLTQLNQPGSMLRPGPSSPSPPSPPTSNESRSTSGTTFVYFHFCFQTAVSSFRLPFSTWLEPTLLTISSPPRS